eukprot:1490791-Amphidinium_carterae.3
MIILTHQAELLDNSRADVWNMLSLVHGKLGNLELAESCSQQCTATGVQPGDLAFQSGSAREPGAEFSTTTV